MEQLTINELKYLENIVHKRAMRGITEINKLEEDGDDYHLEEALVERDFNIARKLFLIIKERKQNEN